MAHTAKRAVFRVRKKIPAEIHLGEGRKLKVQVDDISTRGLAFHIGKTINLPDEFDIEFKLKSLSRPIKLRLEVRNRIEIIDEMRVGCRFLECSDEDRSLIDEYLTNYIDFDVPNIVISVVTFFLFVDSFSRLLANFICLYYSKTGFGKAYGLDEIYMGGNIYSVILIIYAVCSFLAFVLSNRVVDESSKRAFAASIVFMVPALIFTLVKNISYWQLVLFADDYFIVRFFFWFHVVLVFLTGYAIWLGIGLLRRSDNVLDSMRSHTPNIERPA